MGKETYETMKQRAEAEQGKIELRSEKVRNMIGEIPPFLVRWGNTILVIIFLLLIAIGWWIVRASGNKPAAKHYKRQYWLLQENKVSNVLVCFNQTRKINENDWVELIAESNTQCFEKTSRGIFENVQCFF